MDYNGRSLVMLGVLKGAFIFLADLVLQMSAPLRSIEFLRVSSYASSRLSAGHARIAMDLPLQAVARQDVIVVEEIVDTGITTAAVLRYLRRHRPASLRVCALLDKPSRRRVPLTIDYLRLTLPDRFVVGYGLDFDQRYPQLREIYALDDSCTKAAPAP